MRFVNSSFDSINLQLFADGGAGATGDGGTGAVGNTCSNGMPATSARGAKNPLADVVYGKQDADVQDAAVQNNQQAVSQPATEDRAARFEELIKGEFKDLYDARVQDTIQKRLKNSKETEEKYKALEPTLEILAKKYGVKDYGDIEALNKAIEEDDSFFEEEALEKGVTVDQLKSIRKMERENAELKRQMREAEVRENADRIYAKWMQDAEAVKAVYPSFDLQAELHNPKFAELLRANVDVRSAYEVAHKDEIIPAAMQFTAQQVERKIANKIMANGNRPTENGINSAASATVKSDVSQLTKEDRAEIIRRVARGEKIRF